MFKLLAEVHPTYCPSTIIYNWVSRRTGMEIVLIKRQTPAVNGYFTVATESPDNAGCPHTLEHLVFMGSEKYPYKGFLDVLGNQQLSSTNAWTGQDQTVYTLSTAGWQGFSTLLPIYLDHILHAKLEDSACLTEVYHIDGDGQENGVVFSEMQGVENTSFSLIAEASQKLLYKSGSGYSTNTGGAMKALRVLQNQKIRAYHKKLYSPANLSVIITGDVSPEDLLELMTEYDNTLEVPARIPRPFVDSAVKDEPLTRDLEQTIKFPEKDESYGEAQLSWIGPPATALVENTALHVLGAYFTMPGVGKLQIDLLDVAEPLGNDVSMYTDDYLRTGVNIYLSGIPTDKLGEVDGAIMKVLQKHTVPGNLDLQLMKDCVERKKDKFILSTENDPSTFAYMAIDNFLYGRKDGETLKEWLENTNEYDILKGWNSSQWATFIDEQFVKNHHACVLGEPSRQMYLDLKQGKADRQEEIRKNYDLAKLGKSLEDAKAVNEAPIPPDVLSVYPKPDIERITLISTKSASTRPENGVPIDQELQKVIDSDTPAGFELEVNYESYESEFVTIKIYMSSKLIDENLLPYVDTILSELFSMPMKLEDGTLLTFEQVGQQIKKDTLVNCISTNGMLQELIMVDVRTKLSGYSKAIMWIKRAFFNVVFDKERLSVLINKHLCGLAEEKRDGSTIMTSSIYETTLTERSLRRQSESIITEEFFLQAKDDIARVQADMQRLCGQLFKPENLRVLVYGGITKLRSPVSAWKELVVAFRPSSGPLALVPVPTSWQDFTDLGKAPGKEALVTICPATESSYISIVSRGPTDFHDPDIPALTLLNAYLGVTEGPLWKEVRGAGFAYGARIYHKLDMGQIICNFYRASEPVGAFEVTRKLIEDLDTGAKTFEDDLINGAVLSLASALALDQSTYSSAVIQKYFDDVLRKRGPYYVKTLMGRIQKVTKEDLLDMLRKYLVPLFSSKCSLFYAVCHPDTNAPLSEFLEAQGYSVDTRTLQVSDSSDSGYDSDSGSDSVSGDSDDSF